MPSSVEPINPDVNNPSHIPASTKSSKTVNMNAKAGSFGSLMQVAPQVVKQIEISIAWNFCSEENLRELQRKERHKEQYGEE